jgi:plasminogen activator
MIFNNKKESSSCFFIFLIFSSLPLNCSAQNVNPDLTVPKTSTTLIQLPDNNNSNDMVSGNLSLGLVNGTAKELKYYKNTDHKLSELDWRLNQVLMFGAGISVRPLNWLRFNGNLWIRMNDGNGTMDDYDWSASNTNDWTDLSHHDNVSVTEGIVYDLNAELTFFKKDNASFFAIFGYKHENWQWEVQGGTYIYSISSMRDTKGSFPDDQKFMTYEQIYDVPYLGLGFRVDRNPFTFSGRCIGSTIVNASDEEHYLLRDLVITSDLDPGTMLEFDIAAVYSLSPHMAATLAFQYEKYDEIKGTSNYSYLNSGIKYTGDTGIDYESSLVSLSFIYTF